MKKLISSILSMILILSFTLPVFADDEDEILDEIEIQEELSQVSAEVNKQPSINCRAAVVYDRDSKKVLYGKEENTRKAMASTTKIMTCIVVLEKANLKEVVEISKKAGGTGGSRLGLKAKDKVTIQDLLYGLMLRSGNDAAVALAEQVGGSVEGFAELMNQKAEELGLENTHFVTPHGLDETEHYTTAYELAQITDYALTNKKLAEIVNTKTTTIMINNTPKALNNTNELLGNLNGVNGVKTGFTNNAGRCLVTSTTRNGHQIICVVLGADTKKIRTMDSVKLIEYTFSNYQYINAEELIQEKYYNWLQEYHKELVINKAEKTNPNIVLEDISIKEIPVLKEEIKDVEVEIEANKYMEAPVESQTIIGKLEIKTKGKILLTSNIKITNEINKKQPMQYFWQLISNVRTYLEKNMITE